MESTVEKGRKAEEIALEWLLQHGFVLKKKNYRAGHKEIDLIVESERHLHIVEVKSLAGTSEFNPLEKVDGRKQKLLAGAANAYIAENRILKEIQFDVVSVVFTPEGHTLEYIPEAFWPIYSNPF